MTDEQKRHLLALVWSLKLSDFSILNELLKHPPGAAVMTSADGAHDVFWSTLVTWGLAEPKERAPEGLPSSRIYALTSAGQSLIAKGLNLALNGGWPPRESIVPPEAVKMLEIYAANDHFTPAQGQALSKLASLYAEGKGVVKDGTEALKLFRRAADLGDLTGLNNLGVAYYKGEGVPKDHAEALNYFKRAAEVGSLGAIDNIGHMYMAGEGVAQDNAEAVKWFRRAAEYGRPTAMCNLAHCYAKGIGVSQDYFQAYIWYSLGIANGMNVAQARDGAASHLPPEKIKEANLLVSQWKPQPQVEKKAVG